MNPIVTFNNVIKYYGTTLALDELSFELDHGVFTALVGNNGCGKTTTINVLCNLIKYQSGKVLFNNHIVTPKFVSYKGFIGMVLSKPYYVEEFRIKKYWEFVGKFQNIPKNDIKERIEDLLDLLDLKNEEKKQIKNLSSGNQMKVTLGSSLIHNPDMLVLDEPFINIDVETTEKFMNILKGFKGKKTIFITSHNLDLVIELCDNFLIMDKGRIIQNIHKTDFKNTTTLKEKVKKILVKEYKEINLSWLG